MDYLRLKIRNARHWSWYIHANQAYLGRVVLVLNRPFEGSFAGCTQEEWLSLRGDIQLFELFVGSLFSPDRFNYTQMGNEMPQMHVHAIPRYSAPRTWGNKTFNDIRWGQNPSPKPPSPLKDEEIYAFSQWMADELTSFLKSKEHGNQAAMAN
jgi:diadenosine tetraphosphate (Ap4A) HIT family hydrolase